MELAGCGTALVTPFRADGAVDEQALFSLARWQIESGIDWLVACGTTAETPTLTADEWQRVTRIVVEAAASRGVEASSRGVDAASARVPVWVGCSHNSTREAVERARAAAAIPGVSAILSANPYYNKPSQEGQYQHFRAIAAAVKDLDVPVVLYNIPGRTGANLEPATVARLARDCPNITAIKESSGNLAQITELLTVLPRDFAVYSGDDAVALATIGVGGAGLVSVVSNLIPSEMTQMVHAALENDWSTARRLNRHWYPLMQADFWEPNPGPVKAVLAMQGRLHETYRLPMVPVSQATRDRLRALVADLGLPLASEVQAQERLAG